MLGTMQSLFPALVALAVALPLPAAAQTGGVYIPKAIELPGTSAAEATANQIWSLRAALNVAALQCQFSPFLRTVPRYNMLIKQHSKELARAQAGVQGYFRRTGGKAGASAFDRYNTRLYQSYATLDAQYAFCGAASEAAREVLVQPIGRLGEIAQGEVTDIRGSLTPVVADPVVLADLPVADLSEGLACDGGDRRRGRC